MRFDSNFKAVSEGNWSQRDLSFLVRHTLPESRGHYWGGKWHTTEGGERRISVNP